MFFATWAQTPKWALFILKQKHKFKLFLGLVEFPNIFHILMLLTISRSPTISGDFPLQSPSWN